MQVEQLLSMQKQKIKRRVIRLSDSYPIKKSGAAKQNIFIREIPICSGGVGAGLWEAGEMMSRWIYRNSDAIKANFTGCLELGSGVGLTGIVMSTFIPTTMTDYKQALLQNLRYNIWSNSDCTDKDDLFNTPTEFTYFKSHAELIKQNAQIAYIDWFDLNQLNPPEEDFERAQLLPFNQSLNLINIISNKFNLIIGSELNYCVETVDALVNTLEKYLNENGVFWEIISLFRGVGPKLFMTKLKNNGFEVEAREAEEYMYNGIESCQRKRNETYMMWTIYKKGTANVMTFGNGPLVDWENIEYTLAAE
ncbi:Methyltransferase [Hexamita inflata]|uniref:Methyltransferase n=1 Tax=Hexamita inflata TaxID=28002 RepID=A0AA86UZ27_9EUKA|nr:Methyltransferase [Hexamita inflata]